MLCNCAIIGGMVSDSQLLSTSAEAVEAMPPVMLKGCSWASIDHVAIERYIIRASYHKFRQNGHAVFLFLYASKIS